MVTKQCMKCGRIMSKLAINEGRDECDICTGLKLPKSKNSYDYEVTRGIRIKINSEDEKDFLDESYKDYKYIDFEIPDPNSLLSILMSMRLETKRITDQLSDKIDIRDRKMLNAALKDLAMQMRGIQAEIGITREKMVKRERSTQQIVSEWMKDATLYYLQNKGAREGVGICTDCNQRIIFQGDFETLEHEFLTYIPEFIESIINNEKTEFDTKETKKLYEQTKQKVNELYPKNKLQTETLELLYNIHYLLEVRKIPEAYMEYHKKDMLDAEI